MFLLFVFPGFSLGALSAVLPLFWVLLWVSWAPLGSLGNSLVTLGSDFGLTLLHLAAPWPAFGRTLAAFVVKLGTFRGQEARVGMLWEVCAVFLWGCIVEGRLYRRRAPVL